ncbi:MAG: universal stress protein [Bacteroidales bacterium]|nr:universal stress protein [Bacteroidales bacterium]
MEDQLVTVAIHTYERAIILKGILESEGIEVYLHNVNLIQPVISAGVRVRIKESDLAAALKRIEEIDFSDQIESTTEKSPAALEKNILVPVDFSEYSIKAARFAFSMGKNIHANIVFLHTYYSPFYSGGMPVSDAFAFDETSHEALQKEIKKNQDDMDSLTNQLRHDIEIGLLPDVPFICKFREGIPEEQILIYSKKHKPYMIIMGTRGKAAKSTALMGSVTAEVIDRSMVPVFAIPENTPFDHFEQIKNIGFITNFDQRDLIAFESLTQIMKSYHFKVYLIHLTNEPDQWNEIQISGVKEYFSKQYPEIESSYCIIEGENLIQNLDEFVKDRQIDVLTVTAQKRNLFARLFNPGIARKMVFHSDTPLLVLRG